MISAQLFCSKLLKPSAIENGLYHTKYEVGKSFRLSNSYEFQSKLSSSRVMLHQMEYVQVIRSIRMQCVT